MAEPVHCCVPGRSGETARPDASMRAGIAPKPEIVGPLQPVKGGFCELGARRSRFPQDRDSPVRKLRIEDFSIAPTAVSNAQFARFAAASGYRSTAEREGWSYVFHLFLNDLAAHPDTPPGTPWWRRVDGACWHAPFGPGSTIEGIEDHPVVHVSWDDAMAFCAFTGTALPHENVWEYAARGGLKRMRFPWGHALTPKGEHRCNIWQGRFPFENTAEDGHLGTAPVNAFPPNGYGLFNMTGNVWEWCANDFDPPDHPDHTLLQAAGLREKAIRGGSYLCHESYCDRYQTHSRTMNMPDSSTGHMGFRVIGPS